MIYYSMVCRNLYEVLAKSNNQLDFTELPVVGVLDEPYSQLAGRRGGWVNILEDERNLPSDSKICPLWSALFGT
jgi:hypothetical protein